MFGWKLGDLALRRVWNHRTHRRFGSVINRLRSVVFGVSLVMSLFLQFGADVRGVRTFRVYEIVIRFWCLQRGAADINAADQSTVRLLCRDIVQTCLSLNAVGALERVGHATFGGANKSVQKSELVASAKPSSIVCRYR